MDNQDEFRFYNQENNGYNGGFGDYADPAPGAGPGPEGPVRRSGRWKRILAVVLVCALVGGAAGAGGAALYDYFSHRGGDTTITVTERPKVDTSVVKADGKTPLTPSQLYAANIDACVGITVSTTTVNFFGQTSTSAAAGSGFVLTEDGYIVTNHHVVEDAIDDSTVKVEVAFESGDKYPARVVGSEPDNDVAVLKIEAQGLHHVTLGDSASLVVGEPVYTIGNPLGELTYTLTDGLVSAFDRLITTTSVNPATGTLEPTTLNVLQTNCDINPGNSGGPLFDQYGNVVGIVSAKYTQASNGVSAEGLGFALPIDDVKELIVDLIEHGYVTGKPYMGIQAGSVSEDTQRYGIPAGAVVLFIAEDSAAEKAGLQLNDVITAIDDTAIDSSSALTAALSSNYKAGDSATLTVVRQQEVLQVSITFDERNAETEGNNNPPPQDEVQPQPQQPSGQEFLPWPFGSWPFG